MGLEAFRVKNLRCLTDTPRIAIKPITVLVGRNSSGKSTFLRAFPLLRQSVETATESPILWYRDRNVDFGSLANAIDHNAVEQNLTFEFSVRLPEKAYVAHGAALFNVAMTLAVDAPSRGVYVQRYEIEGVGHTASLRFDHEGKLTGFRVNGTDLSPSEPMSLDGAAFLLPTLYPGGRGKVTYQPVVHAIRTDPPQYRLTGKPEEMLLTALGRELRPVFHGNNKDETLAEIGDRLVIGSADDMWRKLVSAAHGRRIKDDFLERGVASKRFANIVRRVIARNIPWILDAVDLVVADFMCRVAYLGPLRATAERSYRVQDLSVSDVDPDGKNLAMFLRSLSGPELQSFAAFTREHLGFESSIRNGELHAEILVREPGKDRDLNLVDIGFGYTEVLPLMAILWSTCCREPRSGGRPTSLLAIEQPELHLHPAHQVKLASVIAGAWKVGHDAGREVKIMVETHSEGIVNGLGDLIRAGTVAASDVQIVLFDQDAESHRTVVRLAGYTDDGGLNDDWPFGFFAPVADVGIVPEVVELEAAAEG
jgi:predicted ATPase